MASTPVVALLPSGLGTLTLRLYAVGSTDVAHTSSVAESTVPRRWAWTVTEALSGTYEAVIANASAAVIGGGLVTLADDTSTYHVDQWASQASVDAVAEGVAALAGTTLTVVSPVGTDGSVEAYRARDYADADGLAFEWTNSAGTWPDLTGATIVVRLGNPGCSTVALREFTASAPVPSGAGQTVRLELTDADLTIRADDYVYNVVAILASGRIVNLYVGTWSVLFALEAPA